MQPVRRAPCSAPPSATSPSTSAFEVISGSAPRTAPSPSASMVGSCHCAPARSIRSVREALVTSVTWRVVPPTPFAPPVRFQISHESIVPTSAVPACSPSRTSATFSISQRSFDALKYVEMGRPVTSRTASCPPSSVRSACTTSLVRPSCQSIASYSGAPVRLSHTTVVSRWLVMPMPSTSRAVAPAFCSTAAAHVSTVERMTIGSIWVHPACGVIVSRQTWCE
mmetsp:Transcript_25821/g.65398  ORF Transcript_25821/g.65398 Transcript_25821/m.65398 type:complete len:224 (-) Transcript_25821:140-811(-)